MAQLVIFTALTFMVRVSVSQSFSAYPVCAVSSGPNGSAGFETSLTGSSNRVWKTRRTLRRQDVQSRIVTVYVRARRT